MKKISVLLSIFLSFLTTIAQLKGSEPVQRVRPSYVIVAFGTSLTESVQVAQDERWTSLLQEMLRQRHPELEITVINAGISGSTTRERLPRLRKSVLGKHPDLVITDFASNDATYKPERHVSLEEFAINIKLMHSQIISNTGAAEIYWPQTPMVSEKHVYRDQPVYVKAGGIDKYAETYRKCTAKVSRRLRVPFVDMEAIFRKKFKENGADLYICSDGVHFTKAGNQLVAESLLAPVEKIIRHKVKLVASHASVQSNYSK
jgi:lysophospholipase L1-like esterase